MPHLKEIAAQFGAALDQDNFELAETLLSDECVYQLGDSTLVGPKQIVASYEQNMLEGRRKFDQLIWGDSWIEAISDTEFYVHFKDYLTHRRIRHVFSCKQRLSIGIDGRITRIEHIQEQAEQDSLKRFLQKVGLE